MDIYDKEIERLTAKPYEIQASWMGAEPLFALVRPSDKKGVGYCPNGAQVGCLTAVKFGNYEAWTPELTAAIRADSRIPSSTDDITVAILPVFAEWQRRIDKELGREPIPV